MTLKEYLLSLTDNPYFGAGFGLAGLGTGMMVLRRGAQLGTIWFRRRCMMSLEVNSRDKSYIWLLEWINSNSNRATSHVSVDTTFKQTESGKITTNFSFIPSPGDHYIRYAGRWLKVERTRQQQMMMMAEGLPYETVTLTTIGWDRIYFQKLLTEARSIALEKMEIGIIMFTSFGPEWRQFGHPRRRRPLKSVVLDEHVSERLVNDVKEFIQRYQWYNDRGVPYRRGYLLHGPPGCGKTSFIVALASELGYSICIANVGEPTLTDDRLQHLLNVAPLKSIIILEDIDAAFPTRKNQTQENERSKIVYEGLTRLTFSGLLNAIDGVASSEGRILFMTTNHVERLDAALIRPGRVDVKQLVDFCSDYQLKTMALQFYANLDEKSADAFCRAVRQLNLAVSPAQIQGHFLIHKDDFHGAMKNLHMLSSKQT